MGKQMEWSNAVFKQPWDLKVPWVTFSMYQYFPGIKYQKTLSDELASYEYVGVLGKNTFYF